MKHPVIATCAAVYAATFASVGGYEHLTNPSDQDVADQQEAITKNVEHLALGARHLVRQGASLGGDCLGLMVAYGDGGVLEDVSQEESIVGIQRSPGQPCGAELEQIGGSLDSYNSNKLAIQKQENRLERKIEDLNGIVSEANQTTPNLIGEAAGKAAAIDIVAPATGLALIGILAVD